jgi:1-aminocyclopropane-1-carboxylate deaminase
MHFQEPAPVRTDRINSFYNFHTRVDVLRLDLIHPVISGNKWFKLKGYLEDAARLGKNHILSFGGAYSNHIVATAAAAHSKGFSSTGLIRGEEPPHLSPTLLEAKKYGMRLVFINRDDYGRKRIPEGLNAEPGTYVVPEGGYGPIGAAGAADIAEFTDMSNYTHVVAAIGTGTMLAGLAMAAQNVQVIGIPVLKNLGTLPAEINMLLPTELQDQFQLINGYQFGGYAKYTSPLIRFMNNWYTETSIPSDFVYTGKVFFAVDDLVRQEFFPVNSSILVIHSGGLQGNQSLPKGELIF